MECLIFFKFKLKEELVLQLRRVRSVLYFDMKDSECCFNLCVFLIFFWQKISPSYDKEK